MELMLGIQPLCWLIHAQNVENAVNDRVFLWKEREPPTDEEMTQLVLDLEGDWAKSEVYEFGVHELRYNAELGRWYKKAGA